MKKRFLLIAGIMAILAATVWLFFIFKKQDSNPVNVADTVHYASAETGFIPEKIIGDTTKAKVILYEYADYGCSHCAEWNREIDKLAQKYGDKLAIVFRAYNLGFNNGLLASQAATAAEIQGHWEKYKTLLFNNQSEWLYTNAAEAENLFVEYFKQASDGKGDIDKFKQDLYSDSVEARIDFEQKMGDEVNLHGTPMFRIDGETIAAGDLVSTIEQKIEN